MTEIHVKLNWVKIYCFEFLFSIPLVPINLFLISWIYDINFEEITDKLMLLLGINIAIGLLLTILCLSFGAEKLEKETE